MGKLNVTVEYWKVPFDKYEALDDLLDADFIKKNGVLDGSYEVSRRDKFEKLEHEHWAKEDAAYPHIIYGVFDNLGPDKQEITTGTAGMLEDWDIVRDSYGLTA